MKHEKLTERELKDMEGTFKMLLDINPNLVVDIKAYRKKLRQRRNKKRNTL
jgi:hypothetical protein